MRNALNAASTQEQKQRDEIASEIIALGYTRDRNFANRLAELTLQKSAAQAAENQFAADYDYRAWQFYEQEQQAARQLELEKAYNELNTFGKVMTKESAAALGVPLGTTTYAVQMQEQARKSSGKSGRGGGPGLSNDGNEFEKVTDVVMQKIDGISVPSLLRVYSSSVAKQKARNTINDYINNMYQAGKITLNQKNNLANIVKSTINEKFSGKN